MPFSRALLVAAVAAALLTAGCGPAKPPAGKPPAITEPVQQKPQNLELVQPFESALTALLQMNETGRKKDFVNAQKHFVEFRSHWAVIRPKLREVDPKLEVHLEDGAVELDLEFKKPEEQIRVYELDEETVKLGRLLSKGAELLNVPIKPELVQQDPTEDIPFNKTQKINVTLTDHKIEPKVIEADQHTKVTFVVTNRGKELHEFALGHYGVEVEDLKPGETQEITLVMLDAGEFETACHYPGHYEVGMSGTLNVKPAGLKSR